MATTTRKILDGALQVILQRGAGKLSMSHAAAAAGVSRGALYRYFPTKQHLLDALTQHLRTQFDSRVVAATAAYTSPNARLRAFVTFISDYLDSGQPHRFLEIEPAFALQYYRQYFPHFVARTQEVLGPVFDGYDKGAKQPVDRALLTGLLVRYLLSELLVPSGAGHRDLSERVLKMMSAFGGR